MTESVPRRLIGLGVVAGFVLWGCDGQATDPTPPGVATILVTPAAETLEAIGATIQLSAAARDDQANVLAGIVFTWSSASQSVATVSQSGLVTAVGSGITNITAAANTVSGSSSVTVAQAVTSVDVSPAAPSLASLGETAQLAVTARDANANAVAGRAFAWTSSDEGVASVGGSGEVTAVANGSATITATTGGIAGTASVLVDQQPAGLLFAIHPGLGESGRPIVPAPSVAVLDALGTAVLEATDAVTITIGANPGGGALTGTRSIAASAGVATFSDLTIDAAGVAYTLVASSGELTHTTSTPFDVLGVGAWAVTGAMAGARSRHTSTLLTDGRVLVVGGEAQTAELFDPATGVFTVTGAPGSHHGGNGATATRLLDGRVLVVGGNNSPTSAEIYDPATGLFSPTGDALGNRKGHSATLLTDGRVLLAGGQNPGPLTHADAELYDPVTGTFAYTGSLDDDRSSHSATLLHDGRVLVAGGSQSTAPGVGIRLETSEIFDPEMGTFSGTGNMSTGRTSVRGILLESGSVLVTGSGAVVELFDPSSGTFETTGRMGVPHDGGTLNLLPDRRVLVAGGLTAAPGSFGIDTVELYDPTTGVFLTLTGALNQARHSHTATLLQDGRVLVSGGFTFEVGILSSVELFSIPDP